MDKISRTARLCSNALALALAIGLAGCGQQGAPADAGQANGVAPSSIADEQAEFTIAASGLSQADGTRVLLSGYLRDPAGEWTQGTIATAEVRNGAFSLAGPAELPLPAMLQVGEPEDPDSDYAPLILGPASYQVNAVDGVLSVTGGHYNDLVYGYTRLPAYVEAAKARNAAEAKAFAGIDHNDQKAMLQAKIDAAPVVGPYYERMGRIAGDYLTKIIEGEHDDLAKFYALMDNPDAERYPQDKRDALMAAFGKTLADNPGYQNMLVGAAMEAKAAAARDAMSKGKPYRDITVADKDGRELKLSEVLAKNKLVLLDFWASWCAPCREDFPYLADVYREYHDAGFEIYAVSLDEERDDWLKALRQESDNGHVPWINLRAQGFGSEAAQAYGVLGLPSSFLIAGDGTILGKDMHKQEIGKVVSQQLEKLDESKG